MQTDTQHLESAVYVYEAPVRLWHWVNALAVVVLALSGYLIASPLPSVTGEASERYVMGYIRFAHFTAGYLLAVGLLARFYWALVGNRHSRELFFPPLGNGSWWAGVWHEVRWYAFLEREPRKYVGHNPLGHLAMFVMFLAGGLFMIVSGFALYSEALGDGSWADSLFGWAIGLAGDSGTLRTWHHFGMWYLVSFALMHVYVAIREDIMSRQSLVSTMISGWRMFKDNRPN